MNTELCRLLREIAHQEHGCLSLAQFVTRVLASGYATQGNLSSQIKEHLHAMVAEGVLVICEDDKDMKKTRAYSLNVKEYA